MTATTRDDGPELTVAVPCYNEEENLPTAIPRLVSILGTIGVPVELLFVNDGSADRTADVVRRFEATHPVRLVDCPRNQGWGGAVMAGFDAARGRYYCFVPADEQVSYETIPVLYRRAVTEPARTIVKIRRVTRTNELSRKLFSLGYNAVLNLRFGFHSHDHNGTPKILRREDFGAVRPTFTNNFFDAELLIRAGRAGYRIVEIDAPSIRRTGGSSHVKVVKESMRMFGDIARFRKAAREA